MKQYTSMDGYTMQGYFDEAVRPYLVEDISEQALEEHFDTFKQGVSHGMGVGVTLVLDVLKEANIDPEVAALIVKRWHEMTAQTDRCRFFIVDVDAQLVVSDGFDSEATAEDYAAAQWGDDWWTNETPYAVWPESECAGYKRA